VTKYNKVKPNWTQTSTFDFNVEINSSDQTRKKGNDLADQKESSNKGESKFGLSLMGLGLGDGGEEVESQNDDELPELSLSFSSAIR